MWERRLERQAEVFICPRMASEAMSVEADIQAGNTHGIQSDP